ncbi:MAG: class A beta-lactamase [Rhodanobacter sp.]
MNRRSLLRGALLGAAALVVRPRFALASSADDVKAQLEALERERGGRLGVAILDTGNGRGVGFRADERFLMCSTFKLLAVSAVLARVDRGVERLDRRIVFGNEALLAYAPITRHRTGGQGMTVAELCQAAITVSDNTAANLLLGSLGGPAAVTAFARSLGDELTRLDRIEPALNVGAAGDLRDTTSPSATLGDMRKILLGPTLSDASREQLIAWLCATTTGDAKLRAGLPTGWKVGDKTGNDGHSVSNDIAIIWPPGSKPLLVTAYYVNSAADDDARSRMLAEVGRIAAASIAG